MTYTVLSGTLNSSIPSTVNKNNFSAVNYTEATVEWEVGNSGQLRTPTLWKTMKL